MLTPRRQSGARRWLLAPIVLLILLAVAYLVAAPRVVAASPASGESLVDPSTPLRLSFNRPVDRASVERRLSTEPSLAGTIDWQDDTVVFTPQAGWPNGTSVEVILAAGYQSNLFLPSLTGLRWRFEVAEERVAFVLRQDGRDVLAAQALTGQAAIPLLPAGVEVSSFAFAPEGQLASFERGPDGERYLALRQRVEVEAERVYVCPPDSRCGGLAISPSGQQLAWEVRPLTTSAGGVLVEGEPSVWAWLGEADAGQPVEVARAPAHSPHWLGPDSLAVYDAAGLALVVLTPSAQSPWPSLASIDNSLGAQAAWSPDGRFVVFPEVFLLDEPDPVSGAEFYSHLFRVELESGLRTDLSRRAAGPVEDAAPAFSPDGLWLAFARKFLDAEDWTPGRQLWLMRSDGSGAEQLTQSAEVNHAQIAWSPDGRQLAFVRFDPAHPERLGSVWVYSLETKEVRLLHEGAFAPVWVP